MASNPLSKSSVLKELQEFKRNICKLTAGQARIEFDEDNYRLLSFVLFITPNDGYYKEATIKFKVILPEDYPVRPPIVLCMNKIYHPNIDLIEDYDIPGSVCVNLLDEDWQAGLGLGGCVVAVLYLFHHPNREDFISPGFEEQVTEREFERNIRASLRGEEVDGLIYDKLIPDLNHECDSGVGDTDNHSDASVSVSDTSDSVSDTSDSVSDRATDDEDWTPSHHTSHGIEHLNRSHIIECGGQ